MNWLRWTGPFQWEIVTWIAMLACIVGGWFSLSIYNTLNARDLTELLTAPVVIAHRGASSVAPENTRSAIVEAIRMKAPVIEFDVRATSDGELVLFHDDDLERLAGRKEAVEAISWSEFEKVDVGRWFGDGSFSDERPIRMAFAIELCHGGGSIPLIERKSGTARAYAEVLSKLDVVDRVIVQSFDWNFLSELKNELPDLAIGALGSKSFSEEKLAQLRALGPGWVGWKYQDVRGSDIDRVHDLGAKFALWTVNDPAVAHTWVNAGVDAIITDVPGKVLRLFENPASE